MESLLQKGVTGGTPNGNFAGHVIVDFGCMADAVFRPHGRYEARISDGLLRSEVHGPMNSEMMGAYQHKAFPLYSEAARGGRFGVLTVWHGSVMMSPETLDAYAKVLKSFVEKLPELAGIAHVAGAEVEGHGLMEKWFQRRCFEPAGLPYRMFSDSQRAENWLKTLLAQ